MSVKAEVLVHPGNGAKEQTWSGFSWPCLFFGCFWFMYKHLWGWGLLALAAAVFTGGLAWLVFPVFANGIHRKALINAGWGVDGAGAGAPGEGLVRCPECRELIRADARKCKHCGSVLVPSEGAAA